MSEDGRDRTEETMADVSHTHPHTDETFGAVFRRGPAVADGGRTGRDAADETAPETMQDVDHTPPHGEGANEVWTRGGTRSVASDGDRRAGDDVDHE